MHTDLQWYAAIPSDDYSVQDSWKCCLRVHHLKYAMLFPACLRVEDDDKTHFFDDLEAVITWLEQWDSSRAATN